MQDSPLLLGAELDDTLDIEDEVSEFVDWYLNFFNGGGSAGGKMWTMLNSTSDEIIGWNGSRIITFMLS